MTRIRARIVTIAALIGITAAIALGFWQLGRAREREALQAAISKQKAQTAQENRFLFATKNVANETWRPVRLRGRWIADRTVFLDNRQIDGKPGFFVLTPLELEFVGAEVSASAPVLVLVQRGWAPRNFIDRAALPRIETPAGVVTVEGRIAPPPAKLYQAGADEAGPIRQNLDLAAWRVESGLASLRTDFSIQQTGAASEGLRRDWPEPASGAARNYGYMVQWWALAALIAVLYVRYQIVLPRRRSRLGRA